MADIKFLDDLTECPICFNQYQRPRCLPCLHTFCEKCLNEYIASQKTDPTTKDRTFNCPVCRHFINAPSSELDETKWAEKFPLNYLVLTLIDQKSLQEGKLYCNPCKKKSKNEQSVSWCIQCKISLCKVCEEFHTLLPILENHKLAPLGEKKDEAMLLSSAHILCGIHSDKPIEMFCLDHNVPCCSTCIMITHRKCENVDTLESVAEKSKLSNVRDELDKGFSEQLKLVEESLCNDATNLDAIDENCQMIKGRIEKERDAAILHLRALSDKAISDVCQFQDKHKDSMAGSLEVKKGRKATIENCQKLLKASLEQSSDVQFFLESRKLRQKFDEMEKEVLELQTIQNSEASYEIRKEISAIMAYDSFGEFKLGDSKTSDDDQSIRVSSEGIMPQSSNSEVDVKTQEDEFQILMLGDPKEIDVEASRSNSSVTGCIFLEDGRLVFTDFKGPSSNDGIIKIYETDLETFRIVPFKGRPWSLASLSSSYIIVAIPHSSKLVVLDTWAFSIKYTIECDRMYFGLAVQNPLTDSSSLSDDDREKCTIFVSSKGDICLFNLNGKRLKDISISSTYIRYIVYSLGRLFCSVDDKVVCTDEDGQVKFEFTDDSLHKATGIAVIKDGHFMVCDYGLNGGVLIVDSKGFKRGVLITMGNTSYVAFNKEKNKMCVIKGGPSINNTAYIYNVNKL